MQSNFDEESQDPYSGWEEARLIKQTMHMSLDYVMHLVQSGSLDLGGDHPRQNRWEIRRQAKLIESLLLNIPVPPIYLAEESRGEYVVIDGRQRLLAIYEYFNGEFGLRGADLLPWANNQTFIELPPEIRTALSMQTLSVEIIPRQISSWMRYEVFIRLNAGGQPLSTQEVRSAAFPGPLNDALLELSQDNFLRQQLKPSAHRDMTDVSYVLRFLVLAETDRRWVHPTQRMLDEFMVFHAHDTPDEIEIYKNKFNHAIRACEAIWADKAFKRHRGLGWQDRVVAEIYDAQMLACHAASDHVLQKASEKSSLAVEEMGRLLDRVLSGDSSARLARRVEFYSLVGMIQDLLGELAAD